MKIGGDELLNTRVVLPREERRAVRQHAEGENHPAISGRRRVVARSVSVHQGGDCSPQKRTPCFRFREYGDRADRKFCSNDRLRAATLASTGARLLQGRQHTSGSHVFWRLLPWRSAKALVLAPLALFIVSLCAPCAAAQELSELSLPPNGDNQKAEVSQWIGLVKVTIAYHSPQGARGVARIGPATSGASSCTTDSSTRDSVRRRRRRGAPARTRARAITFSHDVKVEGKDSGRDVRALPRLRRSRAVDVDLSPTQIGWGSFQYDRRTTCCVSRQPEDAPLHGIPDLRLRRSAARIRPSRFCSGRTSASRSRSTCPT